MPFKQSLGQTMGGFATKITFKHKDKSDGTPHPRIEFGVLTQAASPTLSAENMVIKDAYNDGATVHDEAVDTTETYTVQTVNMSMLNMAMYMLSDEPEEFTQDGSAQTDVLHENEVVGGIIALQNNGQRVYNLTSIQGVVLDPQGAATALNETDYAIYDAEAGYIILKAGGDAGLTLSQVVDLGISYTAEAIEGKRKIKPQQTPTIEGKAEIYYRTKGGKELMVREVDCSVKPSAADFQQEGTEPSSLTFELTVLADTTSDTPFGEMVKVRGPLATNVRATG